ncbi:hypothetical protein [Xenorhabdus szentirmaii]|nr:hypothetical protein [Xenorhabdus szentirmaii]
MAAAPSGERNLIKAKYRIKNQHFVNNLQPPTKVGGLVINGLKVRIRIG